MRGGKVHVVNARTGTVLATVNGQGRTPEGGWTTLQGSESPLLLVATLDALNAFQIVPARK